MRLIAVLLLLVDGWILLVLAAHRLPPGLARDLTGFLPDCITLLRRLWRDPRVPPRARVALGVAALWAVSPIDLIPEFLPVIGPLDDVLVVALVLRYAVRQVPSAVVAEAWPGSPRVLERLLGAPASGGGQGVGAPPRHHEVANNTATVAAHGE